jgi:hypothetical protein
MELFRRFAALLALKVLSIIEQAVDVIETGGDLFVYCS